MSVNVVDAEVHADDSGGLLIVHGVTTHGASEAVAVLSAAPCGDVVETLGVVGVLEEGAAIPSP